MTIMVIWLPKMFLIVIADSFLPIYHWLEIEITGKIHKCTPIMFINDMNLKPPIFQIFIFLFSQYVKLHTLIILLAINQTFQKKPISRRFHPNGI